MEHTAFSHVRCNTLYIIMRHWFRSICFWEMEYARILDEWWNPQHLPIRDRDSNIFTTQVVYIAFIHASWTPQHLSLRYGVHSIYSWEMASTAICHDWCSPNRLISRDGFHIFYWRHMEYTLFTLEKGVHSILTRFNKICHPSQRPRWQVDKEAIGLSRVQQCSPTYNPPSWYMCQPCF